MKLIMESWREFKRMTVNEITGAGGPHEETVLAGLESLARDKNFLFGLPLHLRGFLKYVAGDGSVFTEKDLTEKEIHLLSDFIFFSTRPRRRDPWEKHRRKGHVLIGYADYEHVRGTFATQSPADPKIDISTGTGYTRAQVKDWPHKGHQGRASDRREQGRRRMNIFGGEFVDLLERFLGNFAVYFENDQLLIKDRYDFSGRWRHKNKNFIEMLSDAAAYGTRKGSFYAGLRRAGVHIGGTPYDINIKIPYSVGRMTKEEI